MNYIVLVKQVPDISNIPEEAWDKETGTLKRSLLDNVINPLDEHAMAFVNRMRYYWGELYPETSKIVFLSMGPPQAEEVLRYCLSRTGDEAVLLTDKTLAGADTIATSYSLAHVIRKIEKDIFQGNKNYIIVAGMQSQDGDTAQVPPQIAEELGMEHVAYVDPDSIFYKDNSFTIKRIGPLGMETISTKGYPILITVMKGKYLLFPSIARTRWANKKEIYKWGVQAIGADETRIGLKGSKTQVYKIFSPSEIQAKQCKFVSSIEELVNSIKENYENPPSISEETKEPYKLNVKKPSYRGEIWVYAETENKKIKSVALELITKAKELASSLEEKIGAVLIGNNIEGLSERLIFQGADKVYIAEHPLLENFLPIPYKKAVAELVKKYKPQIMLFGATPLGKELAPRIACNTQSGLTADCTGLEIDDYKNLVAILKQTRPALGGNIMATIMTKDAETQMATVRPGVFKASEPDTTKKGEIIKYNPSLNEEDVKTKILDIEPFSSGTALSDAEIIVAGGYGLRNFENFDKYIRSLASAFANFLGGKTEIGASRRAVEHGFIDRAHQVGQTGQTVQPKLYVAIAISGSVQHISGMQNSNIIVAINKDKNTRIFKHADYGIIGNLETIVPKLIEEIKKRRA